MKVEVSASAAGTVELSLLTLHTLTFGLIEVLVILSKHFLWASAISGYSILVLCCVAVAH